MLTNQLSGKKHIGSKKKNKKSSFTCSITVLQLPIILIFFFLKDYSHLKPSKGLTIIV